MTTKTKPLCGTCEAGWVYPDDGGEPTRCPCRGGVTPQQAAEDAIQLAVSAHPQAARQAYWIIEQEASVSRFLSANSCRAAMDAAGIPGPVRAGAFKKAVAEGLLEIEDEVASDAASTHGKALKRYRSRSFSRGLFGDVN
jgi:hypothetical protein